MYTVWCVFLHHLYEFVLCGNDRRPQGLGRTARFAPAEPFFGAAALMTVAECDVEIRPCFAAEVKFKLCRGDGRLPTSAKRIGRTDRERTCRPKRTQLGYPYE